MHNLLITLLATIWVVVSSQTLRGPDVVTQEESNQGRHLSVKAETTCRLFIEDVQYSDGTSTESWVCELSEEDSNVYDLQYVRIIESESILQHARTGQSTLTVSKAVVDANEMKMYIPSDARVSVSNDLRANVAPRPHRSMSVSPHKTGTLTTLVLRVADSNKLAPSSIGQLENDFFEDDSCLKSQFEACSYGKLKIQPFAGVTDTGIEVTNGVVDLQIDFDLSINNDRGALTEAAIAAAKIKIGDVYGDKYSLIIFVYPPGTGDWMGSAITGGKFSHFNNIYASYVSLQMHEVGHNLGLAHSGDRYQEYNDSTGTMGSAKPKDDFHRCFNPAKSFQLGWYEDQVKSISPLSTTEPVKQYVLNGVADYQENGDALVVLRLEQEATKRDFYIGYNHQYGINSDTPEDKNMVTIVRKDFGNPDEYGKSTKIATLAVGQSYKLKYFNGERDVEIKFFGQLGGPDGFRDAIVIVIDLEYQPLYSPEEEEDKEKPCENYTFEVTTDAYPDDNRFVVLKELTGEIVGESTPMTQQKTKYTNEVCLEYEQSYKFIIYDKFEDGICCGHGPGMYSALDSKGNVVFASERKHESFAVKVEHFAVGEKPIVPTFQPSQVPTAPTPSPTKSPSGPPTVPPTRTPTKAPTPPPTTGRSPTFPPTGSPTRFPTFPPTAKPSMKPTQAKNPTVNQSSCKDKKGKFKVKTTGKGTKKNCKWIKKKKKCNNTYLGTALWRSCPKACKRCGAL
eukprot:jgi/Psemu1/31790/gm1.31790_g